MPDGRLACNTVHTALDRIETLADLPFLHIVDPAARQIQQAGFTTAGLLGSRYTMTGMYFAGRPRRGYGRDVLVAEGGLQDNLHNALYAELAPSCPPPVEAIGRDLSAHNVRRVSQWLRAAHAARIPAGQRSGRSRDAGHQ